MWAKIDFMSSVFNEPENFKEKVEIPKEEINKLSTLTWLKSGLITPQVIDSKIVFNYLEESWCIENKEFNNIFLKSCKENLLNLA